MELRDKVVEAIGYGIEGGAIHREALKAADRILAIPEIKEALERSGLVGVSKHPLQDEG